MCDMFNIKNKFVQCFSGQTNKYFVKNCKNNIKCDYCAIFHRINDCTNKKTNARYTQK